MKKIYLLLAILLPLQLLAQPTIHNAEIFTTNRTYNYVNCDYVSPGPGGANQVWDFSGGFSRIDTMTVLAYIPIGTPAIPTANLVKRYPDSTSDFYANSSSASYLIGRIDSTISGAGAQTRYNPGILSISLPITYNKYDSASFTSAYTVQGQYASGKGISSVKADAWGTLKLPGGVSYNNVIRVVQTYTEADSVLPPGPATGTISISSVSYKWYDDSHPEALLEIDSSHITSSSGGNFNFSNAMYLTSENTAVANVSYSNTNFAAMFINDDLMLHGDMNNSDKYSIIVYNVAGQKIFASNFSGDADIKTFNMDRYLSPGLYVVSLDDEYTGKQVILKAVKQ